MPKHEPMTPKAIANKIKSKGLQKLRWYCQPCQKQCRDENGYKCHMMSESHQRQVLLIADNPMKYIGSFSHEFFRDFMHLLKTQYGTRRVRANEVYNEYIHDRHHIHMNATHWHTLTGFVKFLGREGICEVDQTEKGYYIKYIDRDPIALWKKEAKEKMEKAELDDEERAARFIEEQIQRAELEKQDFKDEPEFTELIRSEDEKVSFSLFGSKTKGESSSSGKDQEKGIDKSKDNEESVTMETSSNSSVPAVADKGKSRLENGFLKPKAPLGKDPSLPNVLKLASIAAKSEKKASHDDRKRKPSALEEIKRMEEFRKEKMNRKDYWLTQGIVVKVISKKVHGGMYYKMRGIVKEVKECYHAKLEMIGPGEVVQFEQAHLETVIPALGSEVLVVNGAYRGLKAKLLSLNEKKFSVTIEIQQGPTRGRVVEDVIYEDICKLFNEKKS